MKFTLTKLTTVIVLLFSASVFGQKVPEINLKKNTILKMPKSVDDDNCGVRGASVVWNPLTKKYYAAFAGNQAYPFAVFDVTGKRISPDTLSAQVDVRGLWFNPSNKKIEGNAYKNAGWFRYNLDQNGIIKKLSIFHEGTLQPDAQSIGTYNVKEKKVIFIMGNKIFSYDSSGIKSITPFSLNLGITESENRYIDDEAMEFILEIYNTNTIVYTGIPNAEIGVLNVYDKKVELYDLKKGFLTKKLNLPGDTPVESNFNFAYTNGMVWLFDIAERMWVSYK